VCEGSGEPASTIQKSRISILSNKNEKAKKNEKKKRKKDQTNYKKGRLRQKTPD